MNSKDLWLQEKNILTEVLFKYNQTTTTVIQILEGV